MYTARATGDIDRDSLSRSARYLYLPPKTHTSGLIHTYKTHVITPAKSSGMSLLECSSGPPTTRHSSLRAGCDNNRPPALDLPCQREPLQPSKPVVSRHLAWGPGTRPGHRRLSPPLRARSSRACLSRHSTVDSKTGPLRSSTHGHLAAELIRQAHMVSNPALSIHSSRRRGRGPSRIPPDGGLHIYLADNVSSPSLFTAPRLKFLGCRNKP